MTSQGHPYNFRAFVAPAAHSIGAHATISVEMEGHLIPPQGSTPRQLRPGTRLHSSALHIPGAAKVPTEEMDDIVFTRSPGELHVIPIIENACRRQNAQ